MANYTYLKHAPIIEAVIDFRAKLPGSFEASQLHEAASKINDSYPTTEVRNSFQTVVQVGPQMPNISAPNPKFLGLFLKTPDQKQIVQFRIDGFAFSRLKPYTKWEEVTNEARRLWQIYVSYCSPTEVNRVAVRYINRVEIPLEHFELNEYLTAPPAVPDLAFSSVITNYFHQIVITDTQRNINATIIQASESINEPKKSVLILDIDVYRAGEFSIDGHLFEMLDVLRDVGNEIFFKSITEETVELFK